MMMLWASLFSSTSDSASVKWRRGEVRRGGRARIDISISINHSAAAALRLHKVVRKSLFCIRLAGNDGAHRVLYRCGAKSVQIVPNGTARAAGRGGGADSSGCVGVGIVGVVGVVERWGPSGC